MMKQEGGIIKTQKSKFSASGGSSSGGKAQNCSLKLKILDIFNYSHSRDGRFTMGVYKNNNKLFK